MSHTLFQLPTALGKGILVTPTVHGNLLTGPTALDIPDKEGTQTSADGMKQVGAKAALSVKNIPGREVITSFAGLRAHVTVPPHAAGAVPVMEEDFVIGEAAARRALSTWPGWNRRDFPVRPLWASTWRKW